MSIKLWILFKQLNCVLTKQIFRMVPQKNCNRVIIYQILPLGDFINSDIQISNFCEHLNFGQI